MYSKEGVNPLFLPISLIFMCLEGKIMITKQQRIVLLVTALGLLFYLVNLLVLRPVAYYLVWPVWTVFGLLIFLALFPISKN